MLLIMEEGVWRDMEVVVVRDVVRGLFTRTLNTRPQGQALVVIYRVFFYFFHVITS